MTAVIAFYPRIGIVPRFRAARVLADRALLEDFLKHIHSRELQGGSATVESLSGLSRRSSSRVVEQLSTMEEQGLIRMTGVGPTLTEEGVRLALQVIRAHRLLERYLHDELRMPLDELHAAADKREHQLSPEQADKLEMRLGYPSHDPHGDPIPSDRGEFAETRTRSLLEWPIESRAVIVHLEDEPSAIFSQLMDAGLYPGMRIEILESGDRGFILWDGLREYSISNVAAGNVSVIRWTHPVHPPQLLTMLKVGRTAIVHGFNCEGLSRRRLLDLGLTPGTRVTHLFDAGFGDPRAFEIRGAVIALRRAETDSIEIERVVDVELEPAL